MSTSNQNHTPTVFISYARKDVTFRNDVCKYLEEHAKIETVYDDEDFLFGRPWRDEIRDKIDDSDAFLALITQNAVSSHYVLYEFVWAAARGKRPVFLVAPDVEKDTIPEPIQELHGRFLEIDNYMTSLDVIGQKLHEIARLNRSQPDMPPDRPYVKSIETDETERMADQDIVRAIVDKYLEGTILSDDIMPKLEVVLNSVRSESLRYVDTLTYYEVIQEALHDNARTLKGELGAEEQRRHHGFQWSLGELLSQVLAQFDELQDVAQDRHLAWTSPFEVEGRRIIASKYVFTCDLFYRFKREEHGQELSGLRRSGYPHVVELDGFKQSPESVQKLQGELKEWGGWLAQVLRQKRIRVNTVRPPTRIEWKELAKPPTNLSRHSLGSFNVVSDFVKDTRMAAVGIYPGAVSEVGVFDAIGNTWELCFEENEGFFIAGWCHTSNGPKSSIHKNWDRFIPLSGKKRGEPVAIRFVAEI